MTKLRVISLGKDEWQEILAEFDNGNITPRYKYEELNGEDNRFKWHMVVHGHNTKLAA